MIVGEDQHWGRRALEFVDSVERLEAPALISRFESLIASCGFTAYIMAGLPSRNAGLPELTLANGWPRDWFDLYVSENFSAVDPVPRHGATTVHPFVWSEAPYDRDRDPAAHRVMTRAADFGLVEGYCIPLHYDDGSAAISMAGREPDLSPAARGAMQLVSIYAHSRLRALSRPKPIRRNRLTPRECEILQWAAQGKTAWEISVILCITERTVKFHLIEAARKLDAANRTAAVAKALTLGLIRL
ncbi:HTH-type quorum sensing-dependent transcriptional regulator RpaR [Rhodopseudomonas palustris]|uniref:HTH-type quorum sensing-dependent transcriptional regulator RpaR n=1 Tax=Rhodopseudomonas palustris TaxID=1076 RepID=UPI000D1B1744|nr:HTH-type quorum sensing-dependent transcriptional regulator RpaR [Rhodopseudomonas palustris]AVT74396.1 HTH-type quorum sensing-dependent transcriptional regulator RpaR [Rhodopseudomonas palustris]